MAITHQGTGTRGAGTTTTTPTLSGGAAGRIALAGRTVKPSTATAAAETGWTQQVNVTGGTGSQGIDTGPQRLAIDSKILVGSDANPTFDQASSPNATSSIATIYSAGTGKLIATQFSNGNDTGHAAGRSATSGTVSLEVGDVIWAYAASDTDFNTGAWTGGTISVSAGAVGSTTERLAPGGSSTGQDVGNAAYEATVTTAATSATITFSTNADGQANCGQVGFVVLRESAMTYATELAATTAETFGTGSHTTAAFTPEANSLLVVAVSAGVSSSGTDILANLTINDSAGLTYTSRATVQDNSTTGVSSYATRIYTAPVGGSPTSMTLTFDCGAVNVFAYHYSVVSITGYDTGSPTGATASAANTGTGALSLTLSGAPAATSFIYGYSFNDVNAAGTTNTLPGSMFTEIHEAATSTPNQWIQAQIATGRTSTTVDWVDTDAGTATTFFRTAVALEIKASTTNTVFGTAAGTFTFGSTAAGIPEIFGVGAGTFTFGSAAAGVDRALGAAAGSYTFTATASGQTGAPPVEGQATGAYTFTGSGSGTPETFGTATTAVEFTGTAAGVPTTSGAVTGAYTFTSTAAGIDRALGTAAASIGFGSTAAGAVAVFGAAASSLTFTAAANGFAGTPPVTGQAIGTYTFASAAAGIDRALGAAASNLTFSSTAAGIDRSIGTAVAPFTVTVTAIGARKTFAQAAAAWAFSATGSGFVGEIPIPAGVPLYVTGANYTLTAGSSRLTTGGRPHDLTVPAGDHMVEA